MSETTCPLCEDQETVLVYEDRARAFYGCNRCDLIFVPRSDHLSRAAEKAVYDHHQNSSVDPRYRAFLNRLFEPMQRQLVEPSLGLDFGSGPGPTLSVMFTEAGHRMEIYDPFYSPATEPLNRKYNFVSCSEVAEHFCDPKTELEKMWSCVIAGGILGIMTQLAESRERFKSWYYKNDPTHVAFFSIRTLEWLAASWDAELFLYENDVAVFKKPVDEITDSHLPNV